MRLITFLISFPHNSLNSVKHIAMTSSFVRPPAIAGSVRKCLFDSHGVNSCFVLSQARSCAENITHGLMFKETLSFVLSQNMFENIRIPLPISFDQNIFIAEVYQLLFNLFWCCLLCCLKIFLDLKVLWQRLQGMTIPSRWFASMWSFMFLLWPSFPHTLQTSESIGSFVLAFLHH